MLPEIGHGLDEGQVMVKLLSSEFPTHTVPKIRLVGLTVHVQALPMPIQLILLHKLVPMSMAQDFVTAELGENLTITVRDSFLPKLKDPPPETIE
jgi:hypothetical protein